MNTSYCVIGIMSGTSLDGLDIAYCHFNKIEDRWSYEIIKATTIPYSIEWKDRLSRAAHLLSLEFSLLHNEYGRYIGRCINKFISENKVDVDFISSHGHTVFHQPEKYLSVQIGSGAMIAAETHKKVICDFRALDVAYQGQGAPLVPIGDEMLFAEYGSCLNIGGFANISYQKIHKRIAFDVCPANIILNHFAKNAGFEFDKNGHIAKSGNCNNELMNLLNKLPFYALNHPKSLGKEWLEDDFLPIIYSHKICNEDYLRTLTEHIALQIASEINKSGAKKVLVTGGGAFNTFLIELIQSSCKSAIEIPSADVINYKEALIFAFLGVLRERNENNCLKSVTGAIANNCGGAIYNGIIK